MVVSGKIVVDAELEVGDTGVKEGKGSSAGIENVVVVIVYNNFQNFKAKKECSNKLQEEYQKTSSQKSRHALGVGAHS